ncbi:CAP domain-containing protein [Spirillospora sp. CA-294931]|uniref:CAP domain-containing protein n=1 Tax=Spirillospora sp. CA-294931 TaxID=3240042 RepID=UPI003D8B949B
MSTRLQNGPSSNNGGHRGHKPRRAAPWVVAAATGVTVVGVAAAVAVSGTGRSDRSVPAGGGSGASSPPPVADAPRGAPPKSGAPRVAITPKKAAKSEGRKPAKPKAKPKPRPTATRKKPAPSAGSGVGSAARQVIALTNAERAKHGCRAVVSEARLQRAAQRHSADMVARRFFDHTNPDGKGPGERITAAGYRWSTYGENIAAGQRTPADVVRAWMNSPGHRANILNCSFKEIGVGLSGGTPHWTQKFGAR